MVFLLQLRRELIVSLEIDSDLIDDTEVVSRYLLSSSDFSASVSRIKPRAFEPSPQDKCTSVFRIDGLQEDEIWGIGYENVAKPRDRRIHARADFSVAVLAKIGLTIRPKEPPKRHALIDGWTTEKHIIMARAQELAANASLKLTPKNNFPVE